MTGCFRTPDCNKLRLKYSSKKDTINNSNLNNTCNNKELFYRSKQKDLGLDQIQLRNSLITKAFYNITIRIFKTIENTKFQI